MHFRSPTQYPTSQKPTPRAILHTPLTNTSTPTHLQPFQAPAPAIIQPSLHVHNNCSNYIPPPSPKLSQPQPFIICSPHPSSTTASLFSFPHQSLFHSVPTFKITPIPSILQATSKHFQTTLPTFTILQTPCKHPPYPPTIHLPPNPTQPKPSLKQ